MKLAANGADASGCHWGCYGLMSTNVKQKVFDVQLADVSNFSDLMRLGISEPATGLYTAVGSVFADGNYGASLACALRMIQ